MDTTQQMACPYLFELHAKRVSAPAVAAKPDPPVISEHEMTEFRDWKNYLGSVVRILERHPEALTAVREGLRRERGEALEREERSLQR